MIEPEKGQTKYDIREIYDDETGVLRRRQVLLDGQLHAPPNGDPSYAVYDKDGNPSQFEWHWKGVDHRDDNPSRIWFHEGCDKPETLVFKMYGEPLPEAKGYHIIRLDLEGRIIDAWTDREWQREDDEPEEWTPSAP